jgi:hypothetical protein
MKKYNQLKADIILDFYLDEICKFRNYKKSDVLKKGRKREYTDVRAIATYLAKKQFSKIGLREIANYFNLKNHATALYSVTKIENLKNQDWDIKRTLEHCDKLDFVEAILINNGLVKVDDGIFSQRISTNLFDVHLFKNNDYACDISYYNHFYVNMADVFDAVIILQNIDSNPIGTLINSLKN